MICNLCDKPGAEGVQIRSEVQGGKRLTWNADLCTDCQEFIAADLSQYLARQPIETNNKAA